MKLQISLPDNIRAKEMIKQSNIPCICRVSGRHFEVAFLSPLDEAIGIVQDWDREMLEQRAPARGGGNYTFYEPGLITLQEIGNDTYRVIDLSLFNSLLGWCLIVKDGDYFPHCLP